VCIDAPKLPQRSYAGLPVNKPVSLMKTCCRWTAAGRKEAVAKQPLVFIAVPTHAQNPHAGMISSHRGLFIKAAADNRAAVAVIDNLPGGKVILCMRNMSAQ
jgi:hypothetical protein